MKKRFMEKRIMRMYPLLCAVLFVWAFMFGRLSATYPAAAAQPSAQTMYVHFLDVGQADSTLVVNGDKVILIDVGNAADYPYIDRYLSELRIDKIDMLVLTHPHEDHIGSGADIVKNYEIGEIYMPRKAVESAVFSDLLCEIGAKDYKISIPEYNKPFEFGDMVIQFLSRDIQYENINNYSIVTKISFGKTSFLFMGDAEYEIERELAESGEFIQSDVLKVGHHGSKTSSSELFLEQVNPSFAVISCEAGNDYGHPHEQVLYRLYDMGVEVFRTDRHGTVYAASDGISIKFSCAGFKNAGVWDGNRTAA